MNARHCLLILLLLASTTRADTFAVIEEITPVQGAVEGGTVVTLRGKGLARPPAPSPCILITCEPTVTFGGKRATLVDVASDGTSMRVRTPPSAGGTYDVNFTFRTKVSFGGQQVFGPPIGGGVTVNDAFTYGEGGSERVLVPIFAPGETPGAFGSRWVTELVGWNPSSVAIPVHQVPPTTPRNPLETPEWGAPQSSFRPQLTGPGTAFMHVSGSPIAFHLRVRDLSRQSESWGTEIPVVPERKAFVGEAILLNNIPNDPDARLMLRIYDFDGPTGGQVDIEVHFDESPNAPFAGDRLDFPAGPYQEFPPVPGFIQVNLSTELAAIPQARNARVFRVVVRPRSDKRLWAFVTITNNRTQQITTVVPQH